MAARSDPAYAYFLDRLVEARRTAGLTQTEVARRLRKPQSFVSKCEVGERRVDVIELAALAVIYGRPLDWFVPSEDLAELESEAEPTEASSS